MRIAGLGFREAATIGSLRDALARANGGVQLTALATPDDKADAASVRALADELGLPIHAIVPEALQAQTTLTQSARVTALRGTGSAAEAAALAAAGPGSRLAGPRAVSADRLATAAIAISGKNR